jgi:hypothetical protein
MNFIIRSAVQSSVPQCNRRIHPHSGPRRKVARQQRDRQHACRDDCERNRSLARLKQLIRFELQLLNRNLTAGVGLQPSVELIEFLHARLANRNSLNTGTEFLKVYTDAVEGEAASTVGTFNTGQ